MFLKTLFTPSAAIIPIIDYVQVYILGSEVYIGKFCRPQPHEWEPDQYIMMTFYNHIEAVVNEAFSTPHQSIWWTFGDVNNLMQKDPNPERIKRAKVCKRVYVLRTTTTTPASLVQYSKASIVHSDITNLFRINSQFGGPPSTRNLRYLKKDILWDMSIKLYCKKHIMNQEKTSLKSTIYAFEISDEFIPLKTYCSTVGQTLRFIKNAFTAKIYDRMIQWVLDIMAMTIEEINSKIGSHNKPIGNMLDYVDQSTVDRWQYLLKLNSSCNGGGKKVINKRSKKYTPANKKKNPTLNDVQKAYWKSPIIGDFQWENEYLPNKLVVLNPKKFWTKIKNICHPNRSTWFVPDELFKAPSGYDEYIAAYQTLSELTTRQTINTNEINNTEKLFRLKMTGFSELPILDVNLVKQTIKMFNKYWNSYVLKQPTCPEMEEFMQNAELFKYTRAPNLVQRNILSATKQLVIGNKITMSEVEVIKLEFNCFTYLTNQWGF